MQNKRKAEIRVRGKHLKATKEIEIERLPAGGKTETGGEHISPSLAHLAVRSLSCDTPFLFKQRGWVVGDGLGPESFSIWVLPVRVSPFRISRYSGQPE